MKFVAKTLSQVGKELKQVSVNHIVVTDVSGSMSGSLAELRTQLKNKLTTLVRPNDTISIVWFSSKGSYGTLVEGFEIANVVGLSDLHTAIDRYLQPVCLTGFKEPLQEVCNIIDRLEAKRPSSVSSLFFMTDGYDNQWPEKDILDVCQVLRYKVANSVVVEYGWNCNRALLSKMATVLGGSLIFNKSLAEYKVTFETELSKTIGGKRRSVKLSDTPLNGLVFGVVGGNPTVFEVENGAVLVPEDLVELGYWLSSGDDGYIKDEEITNLRWAGLAVLQQAGAYDMLLDELKTVGDIALAKSYFNSFSKEDYSRFCGKVVAGLTDPSVRFVAGRSPHVVPDPNAYTVLDLLVELEKEGNLVYPRHKSFSYERIGAEQASVSELRFHPNNPDEGYAVSGLVYSEDRPNVSLRVRMDGYVLLPDSRPEKIPQKFSTFQYRTYTIVRDGIVHTRQLPVSLTKESWDVFVAQGLIPAGSVWKAGEVVVLSFPELPVINRNMVKTVTAASMFGHAVELSRLKSRQKVLKYYLDAYAPRQSSVFLAQYGEAGVAWLSEVGLSEFNGWSPATKTVKSGDFYYSLELALAIAGLSSLPKVEAVQAAIAAKKTLTISQFEMAKVIKEFEAFMESPAVKDSPAKDAVIRAWLEGETKAVIAATRKGMLAMARQKFSVVVGHTWFSDLAADQDSLSMEYPGFGPVKVTAKLVQAEVAL